jgi:fructose-1,6-bisphosphatase II / sedoheptulose-1,7-bisphosphatase
MSPLSIDLGLQLLHASENAALASYGWVGRGDKHAADGAAVIALRAALDSLPIDGTVVIGEGEMDEAPMLYIGERLGRGGMAMDIAIDPLEGTSAAASGAGDALIVMALTARGGFLHAPDVYMDKIAVGPGLPHGVVSLAYRPQDNLQRLAQASGRALESLHVCILDRPRHAELIAACREAGVRLQLIDGGDITGAIAVALPGSGIDLYMGSGGAPEGVLAAAALRCLGGQMEGRLQIDSEELQQRAKTMGIRDPQRIYRMDELAGGDLLFVATGVTSGRLLRGVVHQGGHALTHSLLACSHSHSLRYVETHHLGALR